MSGYEVILPAQAAAGAASVTPMGIVQVTNDNEVSTVEVLLAPPMGYVTVTGVVTNNVTFNFRQVRAGAAVVTFATITLAVGFNLVAGTLLTVPITAVAAWQKGDLIDCQMVQNGTGLAVNVGVYAQVDLI